MRAGAYVYDIVSLVCMRVSTISRDSPGDSSHKPSREWSCNSGAVAGHGIRRIFSGCRIHSIKSNVERLSGSH